MRSLEIRSCIEILANDIEIYTIYAYVLQLIKNCNVYKMGDKNKNVTSSASIHMIVSKIMFLTNRSFIQHCHKSVQTVRH